MDMGWTLIASIFFIALIYASVGHGGASGYLAAMSLLPGGLAPDQMATTALTLTLIVAGVSLASFMRAGHLDYRLAWPFIATSVPAAFLGGLIPLPVHVYAILLGAALGVAAWRLTIRSPGAVDATTGAPPLMVALPVGGGIGWLSGAIGIGGGVFLSPVLLLSRWASPKQAAAASAAFILVNSAAGLGGRIARGGAVYTTVWPFLVAALLGGLLGAHLGANHFSGQLLKRMLAGVLVVAAVKLLISRGG